MDCDETANDPLPRPVVKEIKYRLPDSLHRNSNSDSADMNIPYQSISPPLENVLFPSRQGSSLQVATSATSKSTSIKTSKTVASSSMTTMDSMKTLSVRSTSSKSSFSESKTSGSNRLIDSSSKLVENIAEMQNLFQQNNVSDSILDQIENRCQRLETYLPQWNSSLISSTSTESGCRFKEVKKRTNLAYIRLLRQLVNEVGLDAAFSGSIGVPILEAFCSRPLSNIIIDQPSRSTQGSEPIEGPDGLNSRVNERSVNANSTTPVRNKLRHAVRLLMAKGKDAVQDRDLNSEFMALIEKMTNCNGNTCQDVIEEGGLEYVSRACRSEDTGAVKHALQTMANLLYRVGRDHQYEMVRSNTFAWLLILAMHSDEEIQYYVFLIVTILSNNQELDAVLDRSELISLMIQFVKRHDVREFASHHFSDQTAIFSEDWLTFILPALTTESRLEIQAFAAFHFAIAAQLRANLLKELAPANKSMIETALVKVSGLKRDPAWKLAAHALDIMGSKVPKALSLHVFNWPTEDVICWMNREGFEAVAERSKILKIDGDILLGLTEKELDEGLGISNCIIRRRFLRQLCHLKSIANYSPIDPTGIADFLAEASEDLQSSAATDNNDATNDGDDSKDTLGINSTIDSSMLIAMLTQYTYNLLSHGVTRQELADLTESDLEHTCHISDAIHRKQLLKAVKNVTSGRKTDSDDAENRIDVFISYRRSNGTHLASLVKTLLQLRNYKVFLDIERLKGGRFDHKLIDSIKRSDNFILILTEGALDRCTTDGSPDWVRREIRCALENSCQIIPLSDRFDWSITENIPEDIRAITKFNSVQWTPEFEEGCIDRIIEFMRPKPHSEVR
nr:sterile alpha and tir motif containing protein [Hymenolepis microstoma]